MVQMLCISFMALFSMTYVQEFKAFQVALPNQNEIIKNDDLAQTALHRAVLADDLKLVKKVLESEQIDINTLDQNGKTALDYAVEHGYSKIVKVLFKNNGKVTSIDNGDYARKLMIRPFKILFFISLPLFIISSIVFFPMSLLALLITPIAVVPPLITTVVGAAGWASRAHRSLLLI